MFLGREYLRVLNARFPEIAERLISLQGSAGFGQYIDELLGKDGSVAAERWDEQISSALIALKAEHEESGNGGFSPRVVVRQPVPPGIGAIRNEKFEMVAQRFPHVARNLAEKWGSRDFGVYVSGLFIDTRGGRQGFPSEILFALFNLREQHEKEYPEFVRDDIPAWAEGA